MDFPRACRMTLILTSLLKLAKLPRTAAALCIVAAVAARATEVQAASGAQRAQVIVIPHSHHAGAFFAAHAAFQAL